MPPRQKKQTKRKMPDGIRNQFPSLTLIWRRFLGSGTWPVVLVIISIFLLTSATILILEYDVNQGFRSFGDVIWWTIVTASTVGYGDKVPETAGGRLIA
ncbi:MAG: potassium channel family protein, partial [Desulfobacteria bacterium]